MSATLDSVPGQWTLWIRTNADPTTVTDQAAFAASGQVTVTAGGNSYSGTWSEKGSGSADENVTFEIPDPAGSGDQLKFDGYMVGLAMGGMITHGLLGVLHPRGSWSAYKTSD